MLGALLRSTSFQQDRTELIFVITPHLVKPLQTADVPLPTDSFSKPNEVDVYATGNMEGRGGVRKHGAQPANGAAAAPQTPAQAPAPQSEAPAGPAAALPAPRAPQGTDAQPPAPAEPQKTPAPVAAAVSQHESANAARIARIEAAAARLAAAGSDTPAQPAGSRSAGHRRRPMRSRSCA